MGMEDFVNEIRNYVVVKHHILQLQCSEVLLICVGSILAVCFKYLTTTHVGDKTLMFYSPDKDAYGRMVVFRVNWGIIGADMFCIDI